MHHLPISIIIIIVVTVIVIGQLQMMPEQNVERKLVPPLSFIEFTCYATSYHPSTR